MPAVGADIGDSPGFLEFLDRKKADDPHGDWGLASVRRRFALMEYRTLLEPPTIPAPALETPANGLGLKWSQPDALAQRLANHR